MEQYLHRSSDILTASKFSVTSRWILPAFFFLYPLSGMEDNMPEITVGMSSYNRKDLLCKALQLKVWQNNRTFKTFWHGLLGR